MQSDPTSDTQPSLSNLLGAIVGDAQTLVRQQLALFRIEMKEDFETARTASLQIAIALGTQLIGAVLVAFMAVYGLAAAFPNIPLWACFGLIGIPIVIAGVLMLNSAKKKLESVRPLSDESARAMKENIQWLTNPR
jgi:hypothetical protein